LAIARLAGKLKDGAEKLRATEKSTKNRQRVKRNILVVVQKLYALVSFIA
jgi:hypothetical protein